VVDAASWSKRQGQGWLWLTPACWSKREGPGHWQEGSSFQDEANEEFGLLCLIPAVLDYVKGNQVQQAVVIGFPFLVLDRPSARLDKFFYLFFWLLKEIFAFYTNYKKVAKRAYTRYEKTKEKGHFPSWGRHRCHAPKT